MSILTFMDTSIVFYFNRCDGV